MSRLEELIAELCPDGVEYVKLSSICEIKRGERVTKSQLMADGKYPVFSGGVSPMGYYDSYNREKETITIAQYGTAGYVNWINEDFWANDVCYSLYPNEKINKRFLYFVLVNMQEFIYSLRIDAVPAHMPAERLESIKIPLPPIPIQQEIVRILDNLTDLTTELKEKLTSELIARRKQFEYYRDLLLTFGDEVEWMTLGEVAINLDSKRKPVAKGKRKAGEYPYYGASGIVDYVDDYIFDGDYLLVSEDGANLVARVTPIAFSASGKIWVNNHAHVLEFETYEDRKFIEYYLNMIDLSRFLSTAAQPKLTQENLNKIPVPAPSFEEKERIVAILDRFDALCNDLTSGIPAEIEARQKQYEYYRDKLLTFKEVKS